VTVPSAARSTAYRDRHVVPEVHNVGFHVDSSSVRQVNDEFLGRRAETSEGLSDGHHHEILEHGGHVDDESCEERISTFGDCRLISEDQLGDA
jgi:hypothetical protein